VNYVQNEMNHEKSEQDEFDEMKKV